MGLEADCRVEWAAQAGEGRAHLDTNTLRFKGPFRLSIPTRDINKIAARDGVLVVTFGREKARFHLGAQAQRWADKIAKPPSVLDKLGVKPDGIVAVVGTADDALLAEIRSRTPTVQIGRPRAESDLIFLFAETTTDLARLATLRDKIKPAGAIWTVWPKGRPALKEDHLRAAALGAGLVDVKVCSVSERLSGLKLMIPRSRR